MNYQVLARKWRPKNFEELVGQEHILRALINSLQRNHLHHAYLFAGTRGVGKTTIARILAKCLNCESGITATPCDQCNACQAINEGRFIDLIEVDAASRTKVEDTLDLLCNVQYVPTQGRFKVYLIDEVHMLSGHSFNALLKTLEEPPPHVKFLLATTDPQRLPITVLSRCLQLNLKNLSQEQITKHLEVILEKENILSEKHALQHLSRAANGSIRDALSLLDQAIAFGEGTIKTDDVCNMLGVIEQTYLHDLLNALINKDAPKILQIIHQLTEQAADFTNVLEEFLSLLHHVAITQEVPNTYHENSDKLKDFSKQLSKEVTQLYYQIGLIGRRDLPLAPSAKSGFEMVMLRMLAFTPETEQIPMSPTNPPLKTQATTTENQPILTQQKPVEWTQILSKLDLTGPTKALASHCTWVTLENECAKLLLEPAQAPMLNSKHQERLAKALSKYFDRPIHVSINVGQAQDQSPAAVKRETEIKKHFQAKQIIEQDPHIQAIIQAFDAKILPDSIEAKEKD